MNEHPSLSELENLIDGGLDADQEAAIRVHVAECPLCSGVLESIAWQRNIAHEPTLKWSFSESGSSGVDREFEENLLRNRPHRPNEAPRTVFPGPRSEAAPLGSVDHYDILRLLGQGTFGEVYLAEDRRLERKVALKVLRPKFARSEHFRKQLQDEAKRIARIRSDHVVEVYDVRCQEESVVQFIVMEYVDGCSLSAYLETREQAGETPQKYPREAVQWLYQAALGVQSIHQRGYSHNDLKQGNLLVELLDSSAPGTSRQICRVKIADFGLLQSLSVEERKSASDTGGGTETYMSPQRLESSGDTDTRDDIYSLGVILYHLLTGQFPRMSPETEQIRQQARSLSRGSARAECLRKFRKGLLHDHRTQRLQPMSHSNPAVNPELDSIVATCLAVERQDRYRSASELADDLLAWSEHRPVKAHGRSVGYAFRKWCTRHPLIAALVTLAVVAVSVLWSISERNTRRLRNHAELAFLSAGQEATERNYSKALATLNGLIGRIENNSRLQPELQRARSLAEAMETPIKADLASDRFRSSIHLAEESLTPPVRPDAVPRALDAFDDAFTALNVLHNPNWATDSLLMSLPDSEQVRLKNEVTHALLQFTELQHHGTIRSCLSLGLTCQLEKPSKQHSARLMRISSDVSFTVGQPPLLQAGDLILKVNDKPAWDPEVVALLEAMHSGKTSNGMSMTVLREGDRTPLKITLAAGFGGATGVPMQPGWWCVVRDTLPDSSLSKAGIEPGELLIAVNQHRLDAQIRSELVEKIDDPLGGCLANLLSTTDNTVELTFLNPRTVSVRTVTVPWTTECRMTAEQSHIQLLGRRIRQQYGGYLLAIKTPSMHAPWHIDDASLPFRDVVIRSCLSKVAAPQYLIAAAFDHVQSGLESTPYLAKAFELAADEEYAEAQEQIESRLLQDRVDPDALQLKIICCMRQNRPAEAIEVCTEAIFLMPRMTAYRLFRAELYLGFTEYDLALRDIESLLTLFPDEPKYNSLRQKILDARENASPPK